MRGLRLHRTLLQPILRHLVTDLHTPGLLELEVWGMTDRLTSQSVPHYRHFHLGWTWDCVGGWVGEGGKQVRFWHVLYNSKDSFRPSSHWLNHERMTRWLIVNYYDRATWYLRENLIQTLLHV